jgi:hypothetical protein
MKTNNDYIDPLTTIKDCGIVQTSNRVRLRASDAAPTSQGDRMTSSKQQMQDIDWTNRCYETGSFGYVLSLAPISTLVPMGDGR